MKTKWNTETYEKNPVILENHDHTKILWSADEFILDGNKYALWPGWIEHPDGTKELIELSIIKK